MKKLLSNLILLAGAVLGALAMLAYGLAWQALSRALGFGVILFGMVNPTGGDGLWGGAPSWSGWASLPLTLWQQAHTLQGASDAVAGALLGRAGAWLVLARSSVGEARRKACDSCSGLCWWVNTCVGFFGAMVVVLMVLPGLWAVAHRPEAREFWLQQFILGGVILNPKLWWATGLCRASELMAAGAPQVLESHAV